jgi:cephalosporin hydroxylase
MTDAPTRSFHTFFQPHQLAAYQAGVLGYEYRGVPCLKSPIDVAIYLRLLHDLQPGAIIELGSKHGGSALMFRDFARAIVGLDVPIVSIDREPPEVRFDGVRFLEGDVLELASVFARHGLEPLPRPWLVVEDSAHTADACRAVLAFFAARFGPGEMLAMEDGSLVELGLGDRYGGGPNVAVAEFLTGHPGVFEVATEYCDMFGTNATYNPNGYLRRTPLPY